MSTPCDLDLQAQMTTHSGSVYRVARDGQGGWWMSADNVPSATSLRLDPNRWWRISAPSPWPPELGERLELMAPEGLDRDDARRVPGGGKVTSLVRVIRRPATALPG